MEPRIHVLPEALANKIAAGEVVQRPSSALKELLENSIDAGAKRIEVRLKGSGSTLMHVIDDGSGMGPEDAVSCFRRHATSKIQSAEDLDAILTLGFRGEALASIAAVSQVELRTRRAEEASGTRVRVEGGEWIGTEPVATPVGTSIAVRNLFYNVPARRAFLKTPATEFKHAQETVETLALSVPRVGFALYHEDVEILRVPAIEGGTELEALAERVVDLFGKEFRDQLIPLEEETSYLTIRGILGTPDVYRRSRGEQYLFVNGRFIRHRSLEHGVLAAFQGLLPDGTYPFFALFLSLNPVHVDVNVHPTKSEVKFDDERGMYSVLQTVVRRALSLWARAPISEGAPLQALSEGIFAAPIPQVSASQGSSWSNPSPSRPRLEPGTYTGWVPEPASALPFERPQEPLLRTSPASIPSRVNPEGTEAAPTSILFQVLDRYIVSPLPTGLMVLDQTAAHERVLFERARQSFDSGMGMSQQLLFPHTVEFSPGDLELLKELKSDLFALGFDLDFLSGRSVLVRGVPADIRVGAERAILGDLIAQYRDLRTKLSLKAREALARSLARRSAIAPGTRLSEQEMRGLIEQLFQCETPLVAPDGRPTLIRMGRDEFERRFARS